MGTNSEQKDKEQIMDSKKRNILSDVIYATKPALVFENGFGIFRLRMVDGELVETNRNLKIIGILISMLYTIVYGLLIYISVTYENTSKVLMDYIDIFPSVLILFQFITTVITTSYFLSGTTICVLMTFVDLDFKLRLNMCKNFYTKSRRQTNWYIVILILTHVVFGGADLLTDYDFSYLKIFNVVLYFEQNLEILCFCKMILMLKSRLTAINEYLAKFIRDKGADDSSIFIIHEEEILSEKKFDFIGRVSETNKKIRDLAVMYDTVGETCTKINDIFKFQVFMNLVSTFAYIIITIWTSLYFFRTPERIVPGQLITVVIWCVLTILSVAVMCFTCQGLIITRRNTKLLINDIIMDYGLPRSMRVQAKVFLELVHAWPLRIFVYDMFSIDITLMLKFISVATTFLIVIIQVSHFI